MDTFQAIEIRTPAFINPNGTSPKILKEECTRLNESIKIALIPIKLYLTKGASGTVKNLVTREAIIIRDDRGHIGFQCGVVIELHENTVNVDNTIEMLSRSIDARLLATKRALEKSQKKSLDGIKHHISSNQKDIGKDGILYIKGCDIAESVRALLKNSKPISHPVITHSGKIIQLGASSKLVHSKSESQSLITAMVKELGETTFKATCMKTNRILTFQLPPGEEKDSIANFHGLRGTVIDSFGKEPGLYYPIDIYCRAIEQNGTTSPTSRYSVIAINKSNITHESQQANLDLY
ncbi:MAG: hypothetical protein RPU32_13860 [Candidatus Sedimenticola sp. (ex Thyasira tokunagai)]